MYTVSQKSPLRFSDIFFPNGWEFLVQILHAYHTFLSTSRSCEMEFHQQLYASLPFLRSSTNFYSVISNCDEVMQAIEYKFVVHAA